MASESDLNYNTYTTLLDEARCDWGRPRLGVIQIGRCCICLFEAFYQCGREHPEWFKKDKRAKLRFHKKIREYLDKHVEMKSVLVQTTHYKGYSDDEFWDCYRRGICKTHIKQVCQDITDYEETHWISKTT